MDARSLEVLQKIPVGTKTLPQKARLQSQLHQVPGEQLYMPISNVRMSTPLLSTDKSILPLPLVRSPLRHAWKKSPEKPSKPEFRSSTFQEPLARSSITRRNINSKTQRQEAHRPSPRWAGRPWFSRTPSRRRHLIDEPPDGANKPGQRLTPGRLKPQRYASGWPKTARGPWTGCCKGRSGRGVREGGCGASHNTGEHGYGDGAM